jgi:hypothetical protein
MWILDQGVEKHPALADVDGKAALGPIHDVGAKQCLQGQTIIEPTVQVHGGLSFRDGRQSGFM